MHTGYEHSTMNSSNTTGKVKGCGQVCRMSDLNNKPLNIQLETLNGCSKVTFKIKNSQKYCLCKQNRE